MANNLGYYNPFFYANEALIQLEKQLGMAGRIHRGYDAERRSFGKGETINIRRPGTFTAEDAPSTAQDLDPDSIQITLNKWKEVKFGLTDKDLAFTTEKMIEEHIRPAAVALADNVDLNLNAEYYKIPHIHQCSAVGSGDQTDITGPRRKMFDNRVPLSDIGRLHYEIDGALEEDFLNVAAFTQQQGAGDAGVNTQMRGSLGMKYGFEIFANQNVTAAHTAGALVGSPITNGTSAKGDTTMAWDAGSLTGTVKAGDTFTVAGDDQPYAITADATASGNAISVSVSPPIRTAIADGAAVTIAQNTSTGENLMFHRNAIALATAPLSTLGNELGAKIATVTDPITSLSIRSRLYYEGANSKVFVALDILYGYAVLDPDLAVRSSRY